ncbi:carbohydrate ABC transporter permease [Paenibacillus prosopidis]|uniref:Putative aldouronate transport system permease protein n=1 Tax=Paenibacillus prosopidis TaxID=630520 RepID=A0A368W5U1_9BACL|nr:carbohydrate ABC transporter permease [Paenibacillus prosopidis]RCW48367.1 putative aldouronate transport system permease protein [Paenibacillus prosopidis]
MKNKMSLANLIITIFLSILAFIALFPFYQTIMLSFSTVTDVGSGKLFLFPSTFDLSSYKFLLLEGKVTQGLIISVIVTIAGTVMSLIVTTAGAYALSKKTLPGRNLIFNGIIFTMFFSGGLIPYFLTLQKLHFQNSLLVMIIPLAVNTFYLILMKNFFNTISPSLEESARIDGAQDITILVRIVVPVSMPIIATMILFYAVDRWNEWWVPTLFINDTKLYPLQLVLRNALTNMSQIIGNAAGSQLAAGTQNIYGDSVRSAMIVISAVPIILVYPFIQKYFAKGIMIGSIKG